jgi:hypothetical protein
VAHILVVTFHRGFPVDFSRHIDHKAHTVSYLTNRLGQDLIARGGAPAPAVVTDPGDLGATERAVADLVRRVGPLDVVCAPSEYDLELAAAIRARFGVPGLTPEQTRRCQDKVQMKGLLQLAGLATPAFSDCRASGHVRDLINKVGFPIVLKPRRGAASRGVVMVNSEEHLRAVWPGLVHDSYEAEEFVPGPIYHVDGLVQDGDLRFALSSRYVNTCLQSAEGLPHGSVVVDDQTLGEELRTFTRECLRALGLRDSAFHLELILRDGVVPTFLEIGARPGGAEVQQVIKDLYGVDLLREWVNLQIGPIPTYSASQEVGGWLVFPAPCRPPYLVTRSTRLTGEISHLYYERTPAAGDVHDAMTLAIDRWPIGRFRYAGPSSTAVHDSVRRTIERYQFDALPLSAGRAELQPLPDMRGFTW